MEDFINKVNEYIDFLKSKNLQEPKVSFIEQGCYYTVRVRGVTQVLTPQNIDIILRDKEECFGCLYQKYVEKFAEELDENEEERRELYRR
jgi:hypothetical protein